MNLTEFLTPDHIYCDFMISSKKRLLEFIGKTVAESINQTCFVDEKGVCPVDCFTHLFQREKIGCTGLGNGIALPHAKLPSAKYALDSKSNDAQQETEQPIAIFIKLEAPIEYEAGDHKAVDLVYAMMFPEHCCEKYREGLYQIAQKLSDKNIAKQLRTAQTTDEIWQIFEYIDKHHSEENTTLG